MERTETVKRIQYLVRISRDPDSDWGASVPDLPGCVATGKTLDSALRRIEQAIAVHVGGLRADGLPVPRPRHRTVTPRRRPREIDFYATVEVAALSKHSSTTCCTTSINKLPRAPGSGTDNGKGRVGSTRPLFFKRAVRIGPACGCPG